MGKTPDKLRRFAETEAEVNAGTTARTALQPGRQDGRLPVAYVTDGFFVKPIGDNMKVKVCFADIVWIEAERAYSHIHLAVGKHISVAHNILRLEVRLPDKFFVRISRSEIINIKRVCKYCGNALYLEGCSKSFTVGKGFRDYIFSCFDELEK